MCTVCGCGEGETRIEGHDHEHESGHHADHHHSHEHGHHHAHAHDDDHHHHHAHQHEPHHHDYGQGPAHAHAPGMSQSRMVEIERDILSKNDAYAEANRRRLEELGVLALNLVSSPGSGKTSLLTATLERLRGQCPLAVIEGDQQTANDAERIRATGVHALQINTGKGCHLDAHMVGHAFDGLGLEKDGLLFIENVGNLVCPAAFDLGEAHKVVILSVTEGEDKPVKYPDMFAAADLMILNKSDLLPHVPFDVDAAIDYARQVNPAIEVIQVSALTGEGMQHWLHWLEQARRRLVDAEVTRLEQRLRELRGGEVGDVV